MKKTVYLLMIYLLSCAAMAQDDSPKPRRANGAYLGLYGYGAIPLFQLAKEHYKSGYGFSLAYLSRTFVLSEPKQITWRAGAAFGISGHGSRSFPSYIMIPCIHRENNGLAAATFRWMHGYAVHLKATKR